MVADAREVYRAVEWLRSGKEEQQYQAVLALRSLAAEPDNKDIIREAGGIQELIKLLDSGPDASLTIVSAETICCLVADDQINRVHSEKKSFSSTNGSLGAFETFWRRGAAGSVVEFRTKKRKHT